MSFKKLSNNNSGTDRFDSHLHAGVCSWRWGLRSQNPQCLCGGVWYQKTRGPEHWASVGEVAWENRSPALEPFPESLLRSRLIWKDTGFNVLLFGALVFVFVCSCVCIPDNVYRTVWSSFMRNIQIKVIKKCLVTGIYKQSHSRAVGSIEHRWWKWLPMATGGYVDGETTTQIFCAKPLFPEFIIEAVILQII